MFTRPADPTQREMVSAMLAAIDDNGAGSGDWGN